MTRRMITWSVVEAAAVLMILSTIALGDDAVAGCDPFQTLPNDGSLDFGGALPAIPADFFGPGSDPLSTAVPLVGVPLGTFLGAPTGTADTVVERLQTAVLPNVGDSDTIPIELVALSLKSVNPITVTFNGGQDPTQFDVFVEQSPSNPSTGMMTIDHSTSNGGTYTASLDVFVRVTFNEVGNPTNEFVLDSGVSDRVECAMDGPGEWSHTLPSGRDPCNPNGNFFITATCDELGPHRVVPVPTVSEWGLIVMGLLLFTVATLIIRGRRMGVGGETQAAG